MKQSKQEILQWLFSQGLYRCDTSGVVYSIRSNKGLKYRTFEKRLNGCLAENGYRRHHLSSSKGTFNVPAHTFVWIYFHGPFSDSLQINHIDGNKENNSLSNLECVTPQENMAHATLCGLMPRGERHRQAKLREADVLQIRHLWKRDRPTKASLARQFGVTRTTIYDIVNGNIWKHVG